MQVGNLASADLGTPHTQTTCSRHISSWLSSLHCNRGGEPLSIETLRSHPQLVEQALQSLAAVHHHGVLHGDVQLNNFIVASDQTKVWLLDFEHSCLGDPAELKWERQSLLDLLNLEPASSL